jgi:hypothetical protein
MIRKALIVPLFVALSGCAAQPRPEERVHSDLATIPVRFAAVSDARISPDDPTRTARLMEVIGDLSVLEDLAFVVLAGNMIANPPGASDRTRLEGGVAELKSAAGIIAAPKLYVLGPHEAEGGVPRGEVFAALEAAKLLPARTGVRSESVPPGVRVIAIDGGEGTGAAVAGALKEAREDLIVVAAWRPPQDPDVRAALAGDLRVKVLLVADGAAEAGNLAGIVPIDVPSIERDGAYLLVSVRGRDLVASELAPLARTPRREVRFALREGAEERSGPGLRSERNAPRAD